MTTTPLPDDVLEEHLKLLRESDLLARLIERYTPDPVAPCRMCGGPLAIQSAGGGRATVWACADAGGVAHYSASRWEQWRPGDAEIVLVAESLRALLTREKTQ